MIIASHNYTLNMVKILNRPKLLESGQHDSYDALHSPQAHSQCRQEPHPETHQY